MEHAEAGKYCEEHNSHLVSISSEEELTFLLETLLQSEPNGQYTWILFGSSMCKNLNGNMLSN